MFWVFDQEARGSLASQPGMESIPPALEGDVLITGLPGKSLLEPFLKGNISWGPSELAYFYCNKTAT